MRSFLLIVLVGLFSCAETEKESLSIPEAEQHYLQALMQYGNPLAGYVLDGEVASRHWQEIEVIWYDSLQGQHLYHHYIREEEVVEYHSDIVAAEELKALIQKTEGKGEAVRDLRCLNQRASIFLPLPFMGVDFNTSYSAEKADFGSNWSLDSTKSSNKGRVYLDSKAGLKAELGLFNTGRIRKLNIQKVPQERALQYLDTLIDKLGVFPKPCNWTYHTKDNMAFGAKSGDLFSLTAVFESPYPAFRLFYVYRAYEQEIEIKLENTRPDYGRKKRFTEFCVHGEGSDKACEFLDESAFEEKLNP